MKRIILAVLMMAGLLAFAPSAEAAAPLELTTCGGGVCIGGHVHHHADEGYDPYIKVVCDFGTDEERWIYEGQDSKEKCGIDTDQIYIRYGEELWCWVPQVMQSGGYWRKTFDAQGRHKITDDWYYSCTLRQD